MKKLVEMIRRFTAFMEYGLNEVAKNDPTALCMHPVY